MKAKRWAVIAERKRVGLHGSRQAATDQIASLRARGIVACAEPVAEQAAPSLPAIRFGAAS